MQLLWAVYHGLQSRSKHMEATLGVTGPQRLVLRLVGRHPGASASEIAATLRLHKSTLTGVLRRLEQRGLIERSTDEEDARRSILELTTRGARIDARQAGTVEAAVRRALSRAEPGEIAAAERLLRSIAEELEGEP
ncbi:MAG TPA: MarR family transcriptional regulator [Polyangiaceae bacterium]|nr:MarR family transcriptional regulator [Polyangiaceae bacterium]